MDEFITRLSTHPTIQPLHIFQTQLACVCFNRSTLPPMHVLQTQNQLRCLLLLHSCNSMHHLLQVHAQFYRTHLHHDPFPASIIVQLCCSDAIIANLGYARKVFDQIPHPNTFTWNTIIRAYSQSPYPDMSMHFFRRMLSSSTDQYPNAHSFTFVVKACAKMGALREGGQVHGFVVKSGGEYEVCTTNGLIYMYASCGQVGAARLLFDACSGDHVSWNAMVSGYANCGMVDAARRVFDRMPGRSVVSWNAMLSGYAKCGRITAARELFDQMPERNVESWNSMVSGYARCGRLEMSRRLFDEMPLRDVLSWTTMISAYVQGGKPREALALFDDMKVAGLKLNCATVVSVLAACTQLGSLDQGRCIHMQLVEQSKMEVNSVLGTALVDMYAKCGCIEDACRIFEQIDQKDVFVWTAMITGLAVNGQCEKALELFTLMEVAGVRPNNITFLGVLTACNHGGLVQECKLYFNMMTGTYGIQPQIEHYGCLVDSLGRAGCFEEAVSILQSMPVKPNSVVWGALLGSCWIHGHVEIAKDAVRRLVVLNPNDGGVYALLSNIYTMSERWDKAKKLKAFVNFKGLRKAPGKSTIELHEVP